MRSLRRVICFACMFFVLSIASIESCGAQPYSAAFNGIPNSIQETPVWCWVAVTQQVVRYFNGYNNSPPQCALVSLANIYANNCPGLNCCMIMNGCCVRTGNLNEIQALVYHFTKRHSRVVLPGSISDLYEAIQSGNPVVLALHMTPFAGHVVVLRGMSWQNVGGAMVPFVHVNDPASFLPAAYPYSDLLHYWSEAIVFYN